MSVHTANIIRVLVIAEIFFACGWLGARIWKHRANPGRYLNLMAMALVAYSVSAALELALDRWGKPLSWQGPLIFFAATVSLVAIIKEGTHHKYEKGEE